MEAVHIMNNKKNENNILFFFDVKDIEKKESDRTYINILIKNNKSEFQGKYNYITAGIKAIHDKLSRKNKDINHIICVSDLGDKHKKYFNESFNKIFKRDIDFTFINYEPNNNSEKILTSISNGYKFQKNDTIYILTNSGLRSNVMFFSTFTQIIQTNDIDTKLIYVKEQPNNENTKKTESITDVTEDNTYYDVLRAVNLFTQTGNPKLLKEIKKYKNSPLSNLLDCMDNFYKNIQICKPVNDKNGIVNIYREMCEEIDRLMERDDIDIIIKLLLPTIKDKFMPLGVDCNEPFFQILKWCYNNDMILTGFFIFDAEYKKYLHDKKVIRFKGFDKNGTKDEPKVNLTNPDSDVIKNLGYSDKEAKEKKEKNKYKDYEQKDKENYRRHIKDPINYDACLSIIFRYIVNQTKDCDIYCSKSNTFSNINEYMKNWERCQKCLENWEIDLYSDDKKNLKLYELILLQDFIRRLRNNMAHSDIEAVIEGKKNVISFVENKFDTDILNKDKDNKYYDDITFDDDKIYDKLKIILEQSIEIVKENVRYILSKEKQNAN